MTTVRVEGLTSTGSGYCPQLGLRDKSIYSRICVRYWLLR